MAAGLSLCVHAPVVALQKKGDLEEVWHTYFLLTKPEKYVSLLQKVWLMLCCFMKGRKKANRCMQTPAREKSFWKESVSNCNEISSYCQDFIALFPSVYFHSMRDTHFSFSHFSSIYIADHKEFWLLLFIQSKLIFYFWGVIFPQLAVLIYLFISILSAIFVSKFSMSWTLLWEFSFTDFQIGALTAKILRCYKHFKLLLTMKCIWKLFNCLRLLWVLYSEPS